jgi:hypothetical protein
MKTRNPITIFTTILLVLACFGLLPKAKAVVPAPDGGYPGGNTAEGQNALFSLTTGGFNTAVGFLSLRSNTTGDFNTGIGAGTLFVNTSFGNTATGAGALLSNTTGSQNIANGAFALFSNIAGGLNTATGYGALYNNTTGSTNTANGRQALFDNTSGIRNTALGVNAGYNVTGSGNVCIGADVLGTAGVDNTTWIGNIYTTVQPVVGIDPDSVTVNSAGRLGRGAVSSRRYKHDIKLMGKVSEALFKLKPVSFRYKEEFDSTQTLAFGLIAEEVAEIYPDLVGRNPEGQPESVRYEQINAMLLNEFLKEHRKVEEQARRVQEQEATTAQLKSTVAQQQKEIQALTASLKEQVTQIRKVSAQLAAASPSHGEVAVSKARSRVALNDP